MYIFTETNYRKVTFNLIYLEKVMFYISRYFKSIQFTETRYKFLASLWLSSVSSLSQTLETQQRISLHPVPQDLLPNLSLTVCLYELDLNDESYLFIYYFIFCAQSD